MRPIGTRVDPFVDKDIGLAAEFLREISIEQRFHHLAYPGGPLRMTAVADENVVEVRHC